MADLFSYTPPESLTSNLVAMLPQQSGDIQQSPAFSSWRYNQPQGLGASTLGTAYPKSRRKMRMEAEFQKYQEQQLQQQRALQEMAINQGNLELRQLEYDKAIQDNILNQQAKLQKERDDAEARSQALQMIQAVGTINPDDETAKEKLNDMTRLYPRAFENELGARHWENAMTRIDAYSQKKAQEQQQDNDKLSEWVVGQADEATSLGIDPTKFIQVDQNGVIIKADRLGLAKAMGQAKKDELKMKSEAILSSDLDKERRKEASGIIDKIYENDSKIRENDSLAESAKTSLEKNEFIRKANFYRGEGSVLRQRLNEYVPQKPATTQVAAPVTPVAKFNSAQEAEAANLPKGTIVEIGGRKARID